MAQIKHKYFEDCKPICQGFKKLSNRRQKNPPTIEDVALTYGADFIMNKTYILKDRGVIKHYFPNVKNITKISIEEALDDLLVKKRRRSELDVIRDEQLEQKVTLNEIIKDRQTPSSGLHDVDNSVYVSYSLLLWQQINNVLIFSGVNC